MNNFTVYSKDGCPYCDKIKQVMKLANLKYRVYDLDIDFTREAFILNLEMDRRFHKLY